MRPHRCAGYRPASGWPKPTADPSQPPPALTRKHDLDQRYAPRTGTAHAPTLDVMMMSLTELENQALGAIADGQAGSDPRLASMLNIFTRLAADEEMPAREKTRVRRGRPPARPRRARRHPRRGTVFPQARRLYARLGWQQAMLLLWAVTSCRTARPRAAPQHQRPQDLHPVDGNGVPLCPCPTPCRCVPLLNQRLLAEAFPHRQSAGCAIVQLDPQAHMIGNTCPRANGGSGSPLGRLPAGSTAQSHP